MGYPPHESALDSAAAQVDLSFLGEHLASDVRGSLEVGLAADAALEDPGGPDDLFRAAVSRAIWSFEAKDRKALLPRLLTKGPFYDSGKTPRERKKDFLSDEEVAAAIRLIHSSVINSFQGALAELLAVGPICEVARRVFEEKAPRVFAGDTVLARKQNKRAWGKAADFHLLDLHGRGPQAVVVVRSVAEVKSYCTTPERLQRQIAQHVRRARRGLKLLGEEVPPERIRVGEPGDAPVAIVVVPSDWTLSRKIKFERDGERTFLSQIPAIPPTESDRIEQISDGRWLVTLRWSHEALASVAYEMTFWYLGELGRVLYERGMPKEWEGMKPEEAGQNAAKMMLYYAILRARTVREESRAIALYNSYGFGYALGSNFVDKKGRRRELFYEDLHEIAAQGKSRTSPLKITGDDGRIERTIAASFCRIR